LRQLNGPPNDDATAPERYGDRQLDRQTHRQTGPIDKALKSNYDDKSVNIRHRRRSFNGGLNATFRR